MNRDGDETKRGARPYLRFLPVIVLVLGLVFALSMGWHEYLSLSALRDYQDELRGLVDAYGVMAVVGFTIIYALAIAFSIPGGLILSITGGFLFGTLVGVISVLIGATIGATGVFIAARTAFADILRAKAGPFMKKMEAGFQENALSYLLILRLVPLFPFFLVNIVPAFLGVPLRTYIFGTFFGIIPGTIVFISVGSGIGHVLETLDPENPPELGAIIFEPQHILPLIGLVVLASLPVIYKKFKSQNSNNTQDSNGVI